MLVLTLFLSMMALSLSSSRSTQLPDIGFHRVIGIAILFCAGLQICIFYYSPFLSFENFTLFNGIFNCNFSTIFFQIFLLVLSSLFFFIFSPLQSVVIKTGSETSKNYFKIEGEKRPSDYAFILLFSILGGYLLMASNDLLTMYLSLELLSFSSYILAAFYKKSERAAEAGMKYFLLGALASCFILLGCGLIYYSTGFTNFLQLQSLWSDNTLFDNNYFELIGLSCIVLGIFFKISAAPLHYWAPDVYDGTPTAITAFLIVIPKISLLILLGVGISKLFLIENLQSLFLIFSFFSLLVGSLGGLGQNKIKRLLAFSTISHVGFMLLAFSIFSRESFTSFFFYLFQYSVTNLAVFLGLLALNFYLKSNGNFKGLNNDVEYFSELKNLYVVQPYITCSLILCFFSIAGIPPLVGFFGKIQILSGSLSADQFFLSFVALFSSVVSASYYLMVIKNFFDNSNTDSNDVIETSTLKIGAIHSYILSFLTMSLLLYFFDSNFYSNYFDLMGLVLFNFL